MPAALAALDAGDPDGDDGSKASKLAARAARFSSKLPGNRYKELEEMRIKERKVFEQQGLIKVGKTELGDAVDMRGTCERMCSEYEREFREYTREIHPFEAGPNKRMHPDKAVAAYSRSDAGAGHGDSAILPSDLRTPATLVKTLDYLFSVIMSTMPPSSSTSVPTPRKALGYSAGFIRDRTRAIRKEFAMQSSWGHAEAIASFERIARWHILCLRELQEETGSNTDMHIDSAELGRCFTSLRQHYNDRREELGLDAPCPNEPEFRAYMLIYDLTSKSVSIPTSELPSFILDHPLVKLAWELRRAAQRNFDSQKEGSKSNAELGMNLVNRFVRLLKQQKVPYLLSCLLEIRLREMRRSAVRALTRIYPRLRAEPIRVNEMGEVVERRMILIKTLDKILGCEEQEEDESAWDDIVPIPRDQDKEAADIVKRFGMEVYEEPDGSGPVGALINLGAPYNDNKDAPYTRRWKYITAKRGDATYEQIVNGTAGVAIPGTATYKAVPVKAALAPSTSAFSFAPSSSATVKPPAPTSSSSAFSFGAPAAAPAAKITSMPPTSSTHDAVAYAKPPTPPPAFTFGQPDISASTKKTSQESTTAFQIGSAPGPSRPTAEISPFLVKPPSAAGSSAQTDLTASAGRPVPSFLSNGHSEAQAASATKKKRQNDSGETPSAPSKAPLFLGPGLFDKPSLATAEPKTSAPSEAPKSVFNIPAKPPSPTLPPFSLPRPLSPGSSAPLASTSPVQVKKRSASALLTSSTSGLSRSVSRSTLTESYREHAKQVSALPDVCDLLVDEVIQSMIGDHLAVDLANLVKQRQAAVTHQRRKALRAEAIERWKKSTLDMLLDTQIRRVAETALVAELKRRHLVRKAVTFWRSWARSRTQSREDAARKRNDMFAYLSERGLSRSQSRFDVEMEELPVESDSGLTREMERLDSLQIDIAINHAERIKDNFFAPSTFLLAITRQVGPHLAHGHIHRPSFQTVLSVSSAKAGSAPDKDVTQWLTSKFRAQDEEDGEYEADGVNYETCVLDHGSMPEWSSIGLCVFEAPLRTDDEREKAENCKDAQDRLDTLIKALRGQNRYAPSLLLLTWAEESLEDVVNRLGIKAQVSLFEQKAAMSLQLADDLDERFTRIISEVIPQVIVKEQVIIGMQDVIRVIHPLWSRYTETTSLALQYHPGDVKLAEQSFATGIELINRVVRLARSSLKDIEMEHDPETIDLPSFEQENSGSLQDLVERIAGYLEDDALNGIDDLDILLGPMHQAALTGQPLPLVPALQSLFFLVMGEVREQALSLRLFYPSHREVRQYIDDYLRSFQAEYERYIDRSIQASMPPPRPSQSQASEAGEMDTDASPAKALSGHANGKKRSRGEAEHNSPPMSRIKGKKESKASKNAKLLRALREVERTLEEIGETQGYEVVA
ncbi:hypothetical protein IAU60_004425 [Kwoniella sp. DSM 27419]